MATLTKKAEQSEATRQSLVNVARRLFARRGYADTSIEEIVRRAKVTRGALYHHFADKRELFQAVYETVSGEIADRIVEGAQKADRADHRLQVGCNVFLDACTDAAFQRIALIDARSVLSAEVLEQVDQRCGYGLIARALERAMEGGYIEPQPLEPLTYVLLGGLQNAAIRIARSSDPVAARREFGASIERVLTGLESRPAARKRS